MKTDAGFSPCRTWRYWLTRVWDETKPLLVVIGLNPSTADETKDDPTIRKCITFAKTWGFGGLMMVNLFAFRATEPKDMRTAKDPIGPDNDATLLRETANRQVLCAWGANGDHKNRDRQVLTLLKDRALLCLKTTKDGHPWHPLYVSGSTQPIPFGKKAS